VLNPDDVPKYLNSPQTALFDKSGLLYGLDKARKSIRSLDQAVIVEGYLDVIAPYQAGFTNLVSPMGTALNERQLQMLKRYTRRMVLALDADAAGEKATLRGLQVARQTLDRETDFSFDARGLLHQEGRLQADIRVTTLPEGMDPDDVVNQDAEAWTKLIEAAKPIVQHVMDTLAADKDLDDPKAKQEIAAQVMPLIQDIPSAIERDTYVQQLARLLRVDESALATEYSPRRIPRRSTRRRPLPEPESPAPEEKGTRVATIEPTHKLEAYCLGILIRQPDMVYRIDRALQQAGLARLSVEDFKLTSHQELFQLVLESLHQDYIEPVNFTLDNLPLPLVDIAENILIQTGEVNPQEERVQADLIRMILNLRKRNLQAYNNELRFLQEEAQENENEQINHYLTITASNIEQLKRLDAALGKPT
jgi:DNA primase